MGQTWRTAWALLIWLWELSLYSLLPYQCLPDSTTQWLALALTRLGALAQLSSVDDLGELGYLVILISHMHSHKLWTPQDKSILRLQGDLEGKGSWSPAPSCLFVHTPHSVIPVIGILPFPPNPGSSSPSESQNLDPQQRGLELSPRLSPLIGQYDLHPFQEVVIAGGREQRQKE